MFLRFIFTKECYNKINFGFLVIFFKYIITLFKLKHCNTLWDTHFL